MVAAAAVLFHTDLLQKIAGKGTVKCRVVQTISIASIAVLLNTEGKIAVLQQNVLDVAEQATCRITVRQQNLKKLMRFP